jgi:hypothetical protein
VVQLELEIGIEALGNQMPDGAYSGRSDIELTRLAARKSEELGVVLHTHIGMHGEHRRNGRQCNHRYKGLGRIYACRLGQHDGIDHQRADGAQADRVAVRRRIGHGLGPDEAAGAGAVVDHHGLTQRRVHGIGNQARHDIGGASGRERDHQTHGTLRVTPFCSLRRQCPQQGQQPCGLDKKEGRTAKDMEITFWQDNKNSRATCIERLWDCPSAWESALTK